MNQGSAYRPPLTRQQSVQRLEENRTQIGGCTACFSLPVAIAAVIIASKYDATSSLCNDGTNYTVDLQQFLYIGGYLQIAQQILFLLATCCASCSEERKNDMAQLITSISCLSFIFYIVWAIIGLYIYDNEMNSECQAESIGIMILCWSIIQIVFAALFIGCIACFVCCAGVVLATTAVTGSGNDNNANNRESTEYDPLV